MNTFTFNGINSGTFGLYIGGQNTFNSPQRDITKVAIPGRNGDLIKDNGRFLNSQIAYNIVIMNNFAENAMAVRNWLLSPKVTPFSITMRLALRSGSSRQSKVNAASDSGDRQSGCPDTRFQRGFLPVPVLPSLLCFHST